MRTLFTVAVMFITVLAISSMAARHLERQTRDRAAHLVLPPAPPAGERYVGDYLDGKYNGHGTLVYASGEKYVGEFRDNVRHGKGTYTWPDGRKYEGEFRDGQPDGQGRYTLPNGEEYAGEFRDNRREGVGAYSWPDRRRYAGEFRDDLPNGKGVLTLAGGQRQIGYFRNGAYAGEEASSVAAEPQPRTDGATEVKLGRSGVNFTAPVLLNGAVESQFYVDSGAADVLVPMETFDALLKAGTISQADVSGLQNYRMANGANMRSITFVIRTLKIGPVVLDNVRGTVVEGSAPPLLGMSFLGRFKSWTLDNEREMLVLTAYAR